MVVARNPAGEIALERGAFPYLPKMWLPLLDPEAEPAGRDRAGEVRHAITHRTFRIRVVARSVDRREFAGLILQNGAGAERRGFSGRDLEKIGRSSLLRKALRV